VGMGPGITAGVVDPEEETRGWQRWNTGDVLIWIADAPDYVMQYTESASLGDFVRWRLRTIESGGAASSQSHSMVLAEPLLGPAHSRLVGQVELTEQADPTAKDAGLVTGSITSIGVVYFVDIDGPEPNPHFVRLHGSTRYPEQLEDVEGHRCLARGMLVGLDLAHGSPSR
jgi:hypothetical protein